MDINKFIETLKTPVEPPEGTPALNYLLMAIFFGGWGIHNFWFGRPEKAKVQFIAGWVGLIPCYLGTLAVWVLSIMEALAYYNKAKPAPAAPEQTPPPAAPQA